MTGGGGGWNDKSSKTGNLLTKAFVLALYLFIFINGVLKCLFAGGDVDKNREEFGSSVYQQERVQPCHLSSSIYYGGPDVYFQPQNSTVNSAAVIQNFIGYSCTITRSCEPFLARFLKGLELKLPCLVIVCLK